MKYGLEFAGEPRRVRRTWGRTLLDVLMLLALAALCGWLWSCVRHAATAQTWRLGGMETGRVVAMAPVPQGMIFGLLVSLSALGIVLAVRKARANELEAELRWEACESQRRIALGLEDLREIVRACRVESREALLLVECAQRTVEQTQIDASLAFAQRKLEQVTKTLGDLQRSLNPGPAQAGTTNSEWPSAAAREDAA